MYTLQSTVISCQESIPRCRTGFFGGIGKTDQDNSGRHPVYICSVYQCLCLLVYLAWCCCTDVICLLVYLAWCCADVYWFILLGVVQISVYWFILLDVVQISVYWFILLGVVVQISVYWFILLDVVQISVYWFILLDGVVQMSIGLSCLVLLCRCLPIGLSCLMVFRCLLVYLA